MFLLGTHFVWLVSSLAHMSAPAKPVCADRCIIYLIYLQLPNIFRSKVLLVHFRINCPLDEDILLKGGLYQLPEIKLRWPKLIQSNLLYVPKNII